MTCGIYRLVFKNTDKCYIGQSVNIEKRYLSHIRAFELGNHTEKLQKAYCVYGKPLLDVLLECEDPVELDTLENEAIQIFDSFNTGFNSLEKASDTPNNPKKGEEHWNSKYSAAQILEALPLLLDSSYLLTDIYRTTGVDPVTLRNIASGSSHKWLAEVCPELYFKVVEDGKQHRNSYIKKLEVLPTVQSPQESSIQ